MREVVPGVWRLRVQLPGHTIGHVNAYALVDASGLLLVDSGWSTAAAGLEALLGRVGAGLEDVRGALFTHLHVDHCGLAARLQRAGAWVGMHAADAELLRSRYFDHGPFTADTRAWLTEVGAPSEALDASEAHVARLAGQVESFEPDRLLANGDVITWGNWNLTVLLTPGHTAGSSCFHERRTGLLFTGDHVFPRIKASPTYRPQSTADPVGDYLASLDRLEQLEVSTVLPGHQSPFPHLTRRIDELRSYHRDRMDEVHHLLGDGPATAWQVAGGLNRAGGWDGRSWESRLTALGETHAHLIRLEREGQVDERTGPPSTWSTRTTGSS